MAASPLSNAALTRVHKPLGLSPLPSSHPQHLAGRTSEPMTRPLVPGSGAARGVRVPSWDMGGQTLLCESPQQQLWGRGDRWLGRAGIPRHSVWEEIPPGLREPPARCWSAKTVISTFSNDFAKKKNNNNKAKTAYYREIPLGPCGAFCLFWSPLLDPGSLSQDGRLSELSTQPALPTQVKASADVCCGCFPRSGPMKVTSVTRSLPPSGVSQQPRQSLCCHLVVKLGMAGDHLGTRHPRSILSTTLVNW